MYRLQQQQASRKGKLGPKPCDHHVKSHRGRVLSHRAHSASHPHSTWYPTPKAASVSPFCHRAIRTLSFAESNKLLSIAVLKSWWETSLSAAAGHRLAFITEAGSYHRIANGTVNLHRNWQ